MDKKAKVEHYCFQEKGNDRIILQLKVSVHESEKEKAKEICEKITNLAEEIKE